MMKKQITDKRQKGFFDLGLSLLILAISGGVVLSVDHVQDDRTAAKQEESITVADSRSSSADSAVGQIVSLKD